MVKKQTEHSNDSELELSLDEAKEQIVEIGKKSGEISYEDVVERLAHYELEPEQIDEFYEYLGEQGIEVINDGDDGDDKDDKDDNDLTLKEDRKSTRLNSSHVASSYAVFCLKKKRISVKQQNVR